MKTRIKSRQSLPSCAMLFALCGSAAAQQPAKVAADRISNGRLLYPISARTDVFHQGLRDLGYIEGKNIVIEWRFAEGKLDRLSALAAELARLKSMRSSPAVRKRRAPLRRQLLRFPSYHDRIPILWETVLSPALRGPAGILLGCQSFPELSGKRLELLKEIVPRFPMWPFFGIQPIQATSKR